MAFLPAFLMPTRVVVCLSMGIGNILANLANVVHAGLQSSSESSSGASATCFDCHGCGCETCDDSGRIACMEKDAGTYVYRLRGNMAGAVYVSITVEAGANDGGFSQKTAGVINDTQLDIDSNGNFTLYLGGEPRERNWLALDADATRVPTRHYFEQPTAAAGDINREPRLRSL